MIPPITSEMLVGAFIFAALCFVGMAALYYKGYTKMGELQGCIGALRRELKDARGELVASRVGREKLQRSIDRLILRRDELLACLNAARDDKEKVACIMRLMGEDNGDERSG